MNWTCRFHLAIAFVVFVAASVVTYVLPVPNSLPWWVPFAAAIGFPAVLATTLLILEGPSIFTAKD